MKGFTRALGEGVRRVTIHDVAGKAGVSTAAVSHAFNDPERLRATTVTRILDAARELGYAPNPHARALHSQRVGVLGVLFPQPIATVFANPFFASFLEGIGSVTDERGIGLLTVTPVGGSLERAIAAAPVDGFVIIGLDERNPDVAPLRKRGVPFVVVDGDAETASSVNVDDEGGAHAAAEFLLDRGHRELLVLTFHAPPETRATTGKRRVGPPACSFGSLMKADPASGSCCRPSCFCATRRALNQRNPEPWLSRREVPNGRGSSLKAPRPARRIRLISRAIGRKDK